MFAGAACLVATIPGQASADPPGNNGTVKVDGEPFENDPNNEPHVDCIFQIDWYGLDEGDDLFSHVTFEVHPPTGKPEVILEDDVFIGEDDNSGGGSEEGHDASATYDLTDVLQGFEQHAQQGWHVKLTVNNDGSQGADVKHKVFWVSGCETPPTTSSSTTSSSTTSSSTTSSSTTSSSTTSSSTTSSSTTSSSTTSTSEAPSSSTTSSSTTSTSEAPSSSSSETTSTLAPSSTTSSTMVAAGGQLPETGSESRPLLIAAGIIMLLGGGALLGSAKLSGRQTA
jgi:LPXTG-motif cell wall-anchored protein